MHALWSDSWMALARASVLNGLTRRAPDPSVWAAPINSERMSTPWLRCWHAMNSKATLLIPSRNDEIRHTSARK